MNSQTPYRGYRFPPDIISHAVWLYHQILRGRVRIVAGERFLALAVDILVNNVGGFSAPGGGFAALTDEHWQHAFKPPQGV